MDWLPLVADECPEEPEEAANAYADDGIPVSLVLRKQCFILASRGLGQRPRQGKDILDGAEYTKLRKDTWASRLAVVRVHRQGRPEPVCSRCRDVLTLSAPQYVKR